MARPRIYALGQEPPAADRRRKSLAALSERGGKVLSLRLEPDHLSIIARIQREHGLATQSEAIIMALKRMPIT